MPPYIKNSDIFKTAFAELDNSDINSLYSTSKSVKSTGQRTKDKIANLKNLKVANIIKYVEEMENNQ
jgi:hypothetical protein